MLAFVAANLSALIAREPAVRAIYATLRANLALAFAQQSRLFARDLAGSYASTYALTVKAVVHATAAVAIALRESFGREA